MKTLLLWNSQKLQMLTTKFESINKKDDNIEFNDIFNSCFNFWERIPNSKTVRKISRYLSDKFKLKWLQWWKI